MTAKERSKILLQLTWVLVCFSSVLAAQSGRRLWVLHAPDEIVEYDAITFATKQAIKVPPQVLKSPDHLAINSKGQMLFVPSLAGNEQTAGQSPATGKIWFWNGQTGAFLDRGVTRTAARAGANLSVFEVTPQCFLSADGRHLYWFANEFKKLTSGDGALEISVSTTFRAWQTDLTGGQREQIATFSFQPCKCETGVCSETCPEAEFWIPTEGVKDFFIATHWYQGQVSTTYESSFLYRKSAEKWLAGKLPLVMEQVLDAAQSGSIIIHAIPDGGCCGWDNVSSDQTLLTRNGKNVVFFDEFKRYANPDFDVSFFTSNARLSPDANSVAVTIISTAQPGIDIRLSDQGKPDAKELARIRQTLKELPAVEVLKLEDSPKRSALIPCATLAGWLNDKEILLVEENALVAFDVAAGVRRKSQIKVPRESHVFIR